MFGPSEAGILRDRIPERSEEALADYLGAYERHHRGCPEPFPGIREILERLGRHGCGLPWLREKVREAPLFRCKHWDWMTYLIQ